MAIPSAAAFAVHRAPTVLTQSVDGLDAKVAPRPPLSLSGRKRSMERAAAQSAEKGRRGLRMCCYDRELSEASEGNPPSVLQEGGMVFLRMSWGVFKRRLAIPKFSYSELRTDGEGGGGGT